MAYSITFQRLVLRLQALPQAMREAHLHKFLEQLEAEPPTLHDLVREAEWEIETGQTYDIDALANEIKNHRKIS